MKALFILLITVLFVVASFAQTSLRAGPKINGLALGATREEVIRKLGKPTSESKKDAGECVGGIEMTLTYPGLKISLWDDSENPKKFTAGMFEVTSAKWNVSGARIGQTRAEVKKLFGTRSFEGSGDDGLPFWGYEMAEDSGPGTTSFTFRRGKLSSIQAAWLMC